MVVISAAQVVEMPEEMALAVLNSTKILSSEGYEPRSNLSYVFQETEEFELLSVLQGNSASLKSKNDDRILYVITASTQVACGSLKGKGAEFSEQAIRSLEAVKVTSIDDPRDIVIDGLSGLEQLADGVDTQSDEEVAVYHATLFEDCRYYRFFGLTPRSEAESYRADFRRMTESFARR